MKHVYIFITAILLALQLFAQVPQGFQYQSVVRDALGNPLQNQPIGYQITILSGSPTGTIEYVESHNAFTNQFGIATLNIGNGTPITGVFSNIDWTGSSYFIKVEADPAGGTSYLDMGTTQLLSVPFALYAGVSGNAGDTVWSKNGNNIFNNNSGNVGVGTNNPAARFSITGSSQAPAIPGTSSSGVLRVGIASNEGLDIGKLSSSPYSAWLQSGYNGTADPLTFQPLGGNVGVGINNPVGKMVVQGDASAPLTDPLFEVKNSDGQSIFVVYPDSVHVYVKDGGAKSNQGGFAVSGRNAAKAVTNNYLRVTPDSTRIYTGDTIAGFGVENIGTSLTESYMHLNPSNYFIGHNSGYNVTTGLYNCTFGFKADSALTTGTANIAIGYESGKQNYMGQKNIFIGYRSGFSNSVGGENVFIGYESGYSYTGQYGAVCIGTGAGKFSSGPNNTFVGRYAGMNSTGGSNNVMIGASAGGNFTGGNSVMVGTGTGAGSGGWNTFLGCNVADANTTGAYNLFAGWRSGDGNTTGSHNIFLGYYAGRLNTTGDNNTYVGDNAGYSGTIASGNVCLGYQAGYGSTGSNQLFIENSNDITTPLINGDFANSRVAFNRTATVYPFRVGTTTTNGNGAYLTAGGVWTAGSSLDFKDRFVDLNGQDILNKISSMDLKGWFYKGTQEYHIGPFAEDFYEAFGTGVLDVKEDLGRYLSATDVAGVSLFAVQQLIKENQNQKIIIEQLLKRIENLENKIK